MRVRPPFPLSNFLVLLVLLALVSAAAAQTFFPAFDELPLWKVYLSSLERGYYDLGDGRTVKAEIFELGGCSRGHPCRSSSGLPIRYPEGCPTHLCRARFPNDPFRSFNYDCRTHITRENARLLDLHFGQLTTLSAEWFDMYDTSCVLRYLKKSNTWQQRATGVALVVKAAGFEFPAQTVLVSDIDSLDRESKRSYLDFVQEAAVNFGLRGTRLVKPENTYASDRYKKADLWRSPQIVSPVKVHLTREFLDALDMRAVREDHVTGSVSALSVDLVDNFPEYKMPDYWHRGAGGTVWAKMKTPFDTWTTVMSLGRKFSGDTDQQIHIMPLKIARRCRCTGYVQTTSTLQHLGRSRCRVTVGRMYMYTCNTRGTHICEVGDTESYSADKGGAGLLRFNGAVVGCKKGRSGLVRVVMTLGQVHLTHSKQVHTLDQWPSFTPPPFKYPTRYGNRRRS